MTPPLKKAPEGDWYCPECAPPAPTTDAAAAAPPLGNGTDTNIAALDNNGTTSLKVGLTSVGAVANTVVGVATTTATTSIHSTAGATASRSGQQSIEADVLGGNAGTAAVQPRKRGRTSSEDGGTDAVDANEDANANADVDDARKVKETNSTVEKKRVKTDDKQRENGKGKEKEKEKEKEEGGATRRSSKRKIVAVIKPPEPVQAFEELPPELNLEELVLSFLTPAFRDAVKSVPLENPLLQSPSKAASASTSAKQSPAKRQRSLELSGNDVDDAAAAASPSSSSSSSEVEEIMHGEGLEPFARQLHASKVRGRRLFLEVLFKVSSLAEAPTSVAQPVWCLKSELDIRKKPERSLGARAVELFQAIWSSMDTSFSYSMPTSFDEASDAHLWSWSLLYVAEVALHFPEDNLHPVVADNLAWLLQLAANYCVEAEQLSQPRITSLRSTPVAPAAADCSDDAAMPDAEAGGAVSSAAVSGERKRGLEFAGRSYLLAAKVVLKPLVKTDMKSWKDPEFLAPLDDDRYDECLCWLSQSRALLASASDADSTNEDGNGTGHNSSTDSGSGSSTAGAAAAATAAGVPPTALPLPGEALGAAPRIVWALGEVDRLHDAITNARIQLKDVVQKKSALENAEEALESGRYADGIALMKDKLPTIDGSPLVWPEAERNREYYDTLVTLAKAHGKLARHTMHLHCLLRAITTAYGLAKETSAESESFRTQFLQDPLSKLVATLQMLSSVATPASSPITVADLAGLTKGMVLFLTELESDKELFRNGRTALHKKDIAKNVIPSTIASFRLAICELVHLGTTATSRSENADANTDTNADIGGGVFAGDAASSAHTFSESAHVKHSKLPKHLQLMLNWKEREHDDASKTKEFLYVTVTKLEQCHAELSAAQPCGSNTVTSTGGSLNKDDEGDGIDSGDDGDGSSDADSSDGESEGSESEESDSYDKDGADAKEVDVLVDLTEAIEDCYTTAYNVLESQSGVGKTHDYKDEAFAAHVLRHRWRKAALEKERPKRKRRGRWKTTDNGEGDELESRKKDLDYIRKYIKPPSPPTAAINKKALLGVIEGWWSYPLDMPDYFNDAVLTAANDSIDVHDEHDEDEGDGISLGSEDEAEEVSGDEKDRATTTADGLSAQNIPATTAVFTLTPEARRTIYTKVTFKHARALVRKMHFDDRRKPPQQVWSFTADFRDCMDCLEQQPGKWECWGFLARVFARMVHVRLETQESNLTWKGNRHEYARDVSIDLAKARRCFRYACELAERDHAVSRSTAAKANAGNRKEACNLYKAHGFLEFVVGSNVQTFTMLGGDLLPEEGNRKEKSSEGDVAGGSTKTSKSLNVLFGGMPKSNGGGGAAAAAAAALEEDAMQQDSDEDESCADSDDADEEEDDPQLVAKLDKTCLDLENEKFQLLEDVRKLWREGPTGLHVRAQHIFEMIAPDSAEELLERHFNGCALSESASDDDGNDDAEVAEDMEKDGSHKVGANAMEFDDDDYDDDDDHADGSNDDASDEDDGENDKIVPVRPWQQVKAEEKAAAAAAAVAASTSQLQPTSTVAGSLSMVHAAAAAAATAATVTAETTLNNVAAIGGVSRAAIERTMMVPADAMKTKTASGAIAACNAIADLRLEEAADSDKDTPAGLAAALDLFKTASKLDKKDEWQTHLVLGRISALRGDPASEFIEHFRSAARVLEIEEAPTAENCKGTPKLLLPRVEFHHRYHVALWESFSKVADLSEYPMKELQLIVESFRDLSGKSMEETSTRRLCSAELAEKVVEFIADAMRTCIITLQNAKKCGFKNIGRGDDLPFRICLAKILFDDRIPIAKQPLYRDGNGDNDHVDGEGDGSDDESQGATTVRTPSRSTPVRRRGSSASSAKSPTILPTIRDGKWTFSTVSAREELVLQAFGKNGEPAMKYLYRWPPQHGTESFWLEPGTYSQHCLEAYIALYIPGLEWMIAHPGLLAADAEAKRAAAATAASVAGKKSGKAAAVVVEAVEPSELVDRLVAVLHLMLTTKGVGADSTRSVGSRSSSGGSRRSKSKAASKGKAVAQGTPREREVSRRKLKVLCDHIREVDQPLLRVCVAEACGRTLESHSDVIVAVVSGAANTSPGDVDMTASLSEDDAVPGASLKLARRACKAIVAAEAGASCCSSSSDSGSGSGGGKTNSSAGDQVLLKAAMEWAIAEEGNGMVGFLEAVGNCGDAVDAADAAAAQQAVKDMAAKVKAKERAAAVMLRETAAAAAAAKGEEAAKCTAFAAAAKAKIAAAKTAEHLIHSTAEAARAAARAAEDTTRVASKAHAQATAAASAAMALAKAPARAPAPPSFSSAATRSPAPPVVTSMPSWVPAPAPPTLSSISAAAHASLAPTASTVAASRPPSTSTPAPPTFMFLD